jgi:DNA polymerase III epsilon subunit-like protein
VLSYNKSENQRMALIIDVETTGLPSKNNTSGPLYENLTAYNTARLVQVTMMLCNENFEEIEITDFIVKADGFSIDNSTFHGITNEISSEHGVSLDTVVDKFSKYLKKVQHICAHNASFDIGVLKSELYRYNKHSIIDELSSKHILCSMKHTKSIVNARNKKGFLKNPSLAELYKFATNKDIQNAHNSKFDVINLHCAIKKIYDNNQLCIEHKLIYEPKYIQEKIKS